MQTFQFLSLQRYRCAALAVMLACSLNASAQDALTLRQAFDMAWARQPEARGGELRRAAAEARRDAAGNWLVAPPSLELSGKSDQLNRNNGSREYEVGVGLPLWLPGERSSAQALATAESTALDSRLLATQLRLAASVRDAWWATAQAEVEVEVIAARLRLAEQLAVDVARRVRAGDLARADQHQADGAVAAAQSQLAEAESLRGLARQRLRSLLGQGGVQPRLVAEAMPPSGLDESAHPSLREIADRAEAARRSQALVATQTRANPQLTLATTRDRGNAGEAYAQTVTVGVRIPFGADNRQKVRLSTAAADAVEAEAQWQYEREQVLAGIDAARERVRAAQTQQAAAERRAVLARESRGFFDKSFRLGESDLPTRLRIDLEAFEAERQLARSQIVAAQAVSQLRQALGLLPE